MERRKFIKVTAATTTTLVLPSAFLMVEPVVLASPMAVLGWLARFAGAIGLEVATSLIADYIKNLGSSDKEAVNDANRTMASAGFTDLSKAVVQNGGGAFFYGTQRRDQLNACAPFFGGTREISKVPMLEGPSVIGLGAVAERLSKTHSPSFARNVLCEETRF